MEPIHQSALMRLSSATLALSVYLSLYSREDGKVKLITPFNKSGVRSSRCVSGMLIPELAM